MVKTEIQIECDDVDLSQGCKNAIVLQCECISHHVTASTVIGKHSGMITKGKVRVMVEMEIMDYPERDVN